MKKFFYYLSILIIHSASLHAHSGSSSMNVGVGVADGCAVSSVDTSFSPIAGHFLLPVSSSNGRVIVACTFNLPYSIAIGATANANATSRRMSNGEDSYIGYHIYSDENHTTLWGDGENFGDVVSGVGSITPTTYSVYTQIPMGQASVPAGTYMDMAIPIVVTW